MKKIFLFVFTILTLASCTSEKTTTYYLIRHSEKNTTDKTDRNPNLNEKGLKRAINWATYFKNIPLDAVYSTNYNRTRQTAKPTAESKKLEVLNYNTNKLYDSVFQQKTKGKTVLIVGHSNTSPSFANKILGKKKYENMSEKDNSSLFIVSISGDKKTSTIKKIE